MVMPKPDQQWAVRQLQKKGQPAPQKKNPQKPFPHKEEDEPAHQDAEGAEGAEDQEGGGEPDFAEEMQDWLEGLAEDHPKTAAWIRDIGAAIEDDDDEKLVELWEGAPTDENPEYPDLDEGERKKASEAISKHLGHEDHTRDQAIAIGLREAAPKKYETFDKARK